MIAALDLSKNKTGVAIYEGPNDIQTFTIYGNPLHQFEQIKAAITPNATVLYEKHVHFRNAKVTRILNELNGYIHWRLFEEGYAVSEIFPGKGRKRLIEKYMEMGIEEDEADALTLINAHLGEMKKVLL